MYMYIIASHSSTKRYCEFHKQYKSYFSNIGQTDGFMSRFVFVQFAIDCETDTFIFIYHRHGYFLSFITFCRNAKTVTDFVICNKVIDNRVHKHIYFIFHLGNFIVFLVIQRMSVCQHFQHTLLYKVAL